VLVWDNLSTHLMPPVKEFIAANEDWLTVCQLPSCAPDVNPQEGIWGLVKRGIGGLAVADVDHLAKTVRTRLKKIPYRPHLIDGCLIQAGLEMGE
jgi:transposase